MYYYELGYHSYEDSERIILCHPDEYTESGFRNLVAAATIDVLRAQTHRHRGERFSMLVDDVARRLCTETYGFSVPPVLRAFRPFGWADLFQRGDWSQCTEDEADMIALWDAVESSGLPADVPWPEEDE